MILKGVAGGWSSTVSLRSVGSTAPPPTTNTIKPTTTTTSTTTTTVKATTTTTTVPASNGCSTAKADVLRLVNAERAKTGAQPLVDNTKLDAAAQAHAKYLATPGNPFSHGSPSDPNLWATEIKNAGYTGWGMIGQNIAGGQISARDVMSAWMGSPGHKANILEKSYNHLGVGCMHVATGYGWYWVQDFGANGN